VPLGYIVVIFQCRLATGFEPLGREPNAQTLCIAVSLETLVFPKLQWTFLWKIPKALPTALVLGTHLELGRGSIGLGSLEHFERFGAGGPQCLGTCLDRGMGSVLLDHVFPLASASRGDDDAMRVAQVLEAHEQGEEIVVRSALSLEERGRIREEIILREECEMQMRTKKNLHLLPWLMGLIAILSALAFLWTRLPA